MEIVFRAIEDIPAGSVVRLDFATGELKLATEEDMKLQPKEEPNIIEGKPDPLGDLFI